MRSVVLTASVVLKWYFTEPFSDESLRLIDPARDMSAPDVLVSQVGTALGKRLRTGEVKRDEAHRILTNLRRLPVQWTSASDLAPAALEITAATSRSYNEALYFALAMRQKATLVTADRWWYSLVSTGQLRSLLTWVGDV